MMTKRSSACTRAQVLFLDVIALGARIIVVIHLRRVGFYGVEGGYFSHNGLILSAEIAKAAWVSVDR